VILADCDLTTPRKANSRGEANRNGHAVRFRYSSIVIRAQSMQRLSKSQTESDCQVCETNYLRSVEPALLVPPHNEA
jgi:hypothetical protein